MVNQTDLYADILALNETAVAAGQYEVAFHLLAAALHAAQVAGDKTQIEGIVRLAVEQGAAVDSHADHPMAAASARRRGNIPLYESLAATARGKLAQIESQQLIERGQILSKEDVREDNS